jgi:hypothetical protein
MKASVRLKLIRQIAQKLGTESWTIINLTLEQFNMPVSRTKRGEAVEYILRQISKGEDDALLDLARHLEIDNVEQPSLSAPTFWKNGKVRLFISHLARKKDVATALRDELDKSGISGFVAHNDITPSREWQHEIELALDTCDAMVALMIDGFHKSQWTDHEVGFILGRKLPIIPVNMGEAPYGFISKFQAYKFHDVPKLADTLFKLMLNDPRTTKKMSLALVQQFENSSSFASANSNLKLLRKLRYWDSSLVDRLKIASRKNDQIKGSFDVPEGVTALLKKIAKKE